MIRPRRSVLVLPGSSRKMAAKAATLPADEVILDLEDAVPPDSEAKSQARRELLQSLTELDFGDRLLAVRINQVPGPFALADLTQVVAKVGQRLSAVVVPKVNDPAQVAFVVNALCSMEQELGWERQLAVEVQIEDPLGLSRCEAIAACSPRLETLIFGPGDFAAAMGMPATAIGAESPDYPGDLWHYPLFRLTAAARAAGLQAIDGPCSDLGDLPALQRSAGRAAALGMDGKWAIHPSQLEVLNSAFTPSSEQTSRAREILAQLRAQGGSLRLGEEMIDEASRRMAEAVLARARPQVQAG